MTPTEKVTRAFIGFGGAQISPPGMRFWMIYCILAPDSLHLLVRKLQANCKQFKQRAFEYQQNLSISALPEAVLLHRGFQNYFTSIIRIFPLDSSFSQQQLSWNGKSSFLPRRPSAGAMPVLLQSRAPAAQPGERPGQQAAREGSASKLHLSRHWIPELSSSFPERKLPQISEVNTSQTVKECIPVPARWPFAQLQHQNTNINPFYK